MEDETNLTTWFLFLFVVVVVVVVVVLQLYELKERPDGVSRLLLKYGIWVELPEVPGSPIIESEKVVNPLTKRHYEIKFIGEEGKQQESTMHLSRQIWFDGNLADK